MPVSRATDGTITPYADEAMRLLRETWANPTMLAEEVFAILQRGIPLPRSAPVNVNLAFGTSWPGVNIRQFGTGPIMRFKNSAGQTAEITQGFEFIINDDAPIAPNENTGGMASKITPTIVWTNKTIVDGDALSATQLNAVATDPRTGSTIPGAFVYTPPSGTTINIGDGVTQSLSVTFTPTNQRSYKRARKTIVLTVIASKITPTYQITPGDLYDNITLAEGGFSAIAKNGVTTVAGTMTYDPALSTTPTQPSVDIECTFVPDDTDMYNTPAPTTSTYTVNQGTLGGQGTVTAIGVGDSRTFGSVMVSRSGLTPEAHGDVTATAAMGSSVPGIGQEAGLTYDYGTLTWTYNYAGS